jgi:hypothetical protein
MRHVVHKEVMDTLQDIKESRCMGVLSNLVVQTSRRYCMVHLEHRLLSNLYLLYSCTDFGLVTP